MDIQLKIMKTELLFFMKLKMCVFDFAGVEEGIALEMEGRVLILILLQSCV